jgi:hypothetical protein
MALLKKKTGWLLFIFILCCPFNQLVGLHGAASPATVCRDEGRGSVNTQFLA